jgi:SAM-dependent methyltransferase
MVDLHVSNTIRKLDEPPPQGQGGAGEIPPIVLKEVYEQRFNEADQAAKEAIWRELGRFFQRFIEPGARVVDIACDLGYFIRNIKAADRWATDIRDVGDALPKDVHFVHASGLELADVLPNDHFDLAFFSNYLEHLPSTEAVLQQLRVTYAILKPGGRVLILQPNIRLIGGSYWNFIDHQTALTEKSLAEAAVMAGFETKRVITRFMPYTTKSRLPQHPLLVRAYLAFPPLWWLMGKQTLYLAEKPT